MAADYNWVLINFSQSTAIIASSIKGCTSIVYT